MTPSKHLDEMTLLLYVERQLDRERAQEVSLHTQTCTRCMTLLRALDRESRLLTRAMLEQEEPFPTRLAEFRGAVKRSMQWIWGLIFGLAVLGVYALYAGYIEPWEQQLEQAGFGSTNLLSLLVFQGAFWKGWQSMFTLFEGLALAVLAGSAALPSESTSEGAPRWRWCLPAWGCCSQQRRRRPPPNFVKAIP